MNTREAHRRTHPQANLKLCPGQGEPLQPGKRLDRHGAKPPRQGAPRKGHAGKRAPATAYPKQRPPGRLAASNGTQASGGRRRNRGRERQTQRLTAADTDTFHARTGAERAGNEFDGHRRRSDPQPLLLFAGLRRLPDGERHPRRAWGRSGTGGPGGKVSRRPAALLIARIGRARRPLDDQSEPGGTTALPSYASAKRRTSAGAAAGPYHRAKRAPLPAEGGDPLRFRLTEHLRGV